MLERKLVLSVVSLLALAGLSTAAAQPTSTYVVRTKLQSNTGSGPETRAEVGDVVTLLERKENRFRVLTAGGFQGWVRSKSIVRLEDAVPVYDRLIRQQPDKARLYELRGNVRAARGEAEQAVADYSRALELGEPNAELYQRRGAFLIQLKAYEDAIRDLSRASELGAEGPAIHANRAAAYMASGDYAGAIKDYSILIETAPDQADWYIQRGIAHRRASDWARAIKDFSRAIELSPANQTAIGHRGFAYYRLGEHRKAIDDFTQVIRLNPKDAVAHNNRGFNRQRLGDYEGALADYRRSIQLAPDYALALQNVAWLLATCPDTRYRDGKTAAKVATKLCQLREYRVASDLKALAAAHAELGEFESAVKLQTKVVEKTIGEAKTTEQELLKLYTSRQPFRSLPE